jgi:hypothetical protein
MRLLPHVRTALVIGALSAGAARLQAQAPATTPAAQALRDEIDQLKRDFDARMAALETKLAALDGSAAAPAAPPTPQPAAAPEVPTAQVPAGAEGGGGPSGALPVYGNVSAASKIFNPDMAVIGNFLGAAGRNRVGAEPALQMAESEASFQAIVDPTRAPISSWRSANRGSISKRGSSPSRRCRAVCWSAPEKCARRSAR